MRRRRDAASLAVPARKHITDPFDRLLAEPDVGKRADDIAHHVLQESIGCNLERQPVALPRNRNVVDGANEIQVSFTSGIKTRGTVIGTDTDSDLAVIKVDLPEEELVSVPLGSPSATRSLVVRAEGVPSSAALAFGRAAPSVQIQSSTRRPGVYASGSPKLSGAPGPTI